MFESADSPIITPSAFVLGVNRLRKKKIHSKRMVDHIIKTTIGQATLPPEGRGSKSMLSPKDVALGIEGLALLDLRLPPGFVVRCTRAIREAWNDIFPPPFLNETLKALVSSSSPSPLEQLEKLPKRFLCFRMAPHRISGITRVSVVDELNDIFKFDPTTEPYRWAGGPVITADLTSDLFRIVTELEAYSARLLP
jgi:hypothetical protein